MRRALAMPRINRQQKAFPVPIQAPIGGWNSRDSLDDMKPEDAVLLDNFFPGFGSCIVRSGSSQYATGLGGPVQMLAEFNAGSLRKFIAGASGNIWDISAAGAAISLASGFASNIWNWAQFDDSAGGARLGLVNGTSAPQLYNGTAISAMTISGSGLTATTLNGIHIYKNRSFFWDDRTQDFWFSATNALGGTMTKFPLGRVQGTGGNLIAMGTWSVDAGDGQDDKAVFVLASGDILVYTGDDPSSPSAWALTGRYFLGAPISKRAIKKIGADLVIVTKAGYVPLTAAFESGAFNSQGKAISSKIRGAAIAAVRLYGANFGWEICYYPRRNWLIVNVPTSTTVAVQHVMNSETGAWCRFTEFNSLCWGLYNDDLYFGRSDGTVWLADTGTSDGGAPIIAQGQPAWNYLGSARNSKRATGIKPVLRSSGGTVGYTINVGFDFVEVLLSTSISPGDNTGSLWDVSPWDTTPWGDDFQISDKWSSVASDGYAISCKLKVSTVSQTIEWLSTTYLVENGGVL